MSIHEWAPRLDRRGLTARVIVAVLSIKPPERAA